MNEIEQVIQRILERRASVPHNRALLVALSGIDGSGKGYVARQIEAHLGQYGTAAAVLNVDRWLNLPEKRFNQSAPAEHFYEYAIRFDEFFSQLVIPLRDNRSVHLVADLAKETDGNFHKQAYIFKDVSVILLEGIFLFKSEFRRFFDLAIWLDCSFPTALARALERKQEGLPPAATIDVYETIYFPAQRIHLERDDPRRSADLILTNDPYFGKDFWYTHRHRPKPQVQTAH